MKRRKDSSQHLPQNKLAHIVVELRATFIIKIFCKTFHLPQCPRMITFKNGRNEKFVKTARKVGYTHSYKKGFFALTK